MYSSPGTPTGHGMPFGSRTWIHVFAMGRPSDTASLPSLRPAGRVASVMSLTIDQIVVSVGPYRFQTRRHRDRISWANAGVSASPPHSATSRAVAAHPLSTSIRHVAGVAWRRVAPVSSSRRRSSFGSATAARSAITTVPPAASGPSNSSPAMSNDSVVTASSTSASPIPGSSIIDEMKFDRLPWVTCTPFGSPWTRRCRARTRRRPGRGRSAVTRPGAWEQGCRRPRSRVRHRSRRPDRDG